MGAGCLPLAGHCTELVGSWGHQGHKDTMVAGAGLPGRHFSEKLKCCKRLVKKRKSSMRARGSPRHVRRPVGGHGGSLSLDLPLQDPLRLGKQTGHPPHPQGTCREGYEGLLLDEAPLGIQEVLWVEVERLLPDGLVLQH